MDYKTQMEEIAKRVKETKAKMEGQHEMIQALREAGEDVTALNNEYEKQKIRVNKWIDMLNSRGYKV